VRPPCPLADGLYLCRYYAQHPPPFIITQGRGTWHKVGPKDEKGFEIHEAAMNADWLIKHGIPAEMILEENSSMETVGNAFFVRVLHSDVLGFHRMAVINNAWHMRRTSDVFSHVFSVPRRSEKLESTRRPVLTFVACASGLDAQVERHRLASEEVKIPKFALGSKWQADTRTLESLHLWLHRENMAYSPSARHHGEPSSLRPPVDPSVAQSY